MLKSLSILIAAMWLVMTVQPTPARAQGQLRDGEYEFVVDRSAATLAVPGPIGRVAATMPLSSGRLTVDAEGQISTVETVFDATSAHSKNNFVGKQLRGPAGLHAEKFPTVSFVGTSAAIDGQTVIISGDLTVRGITKPMSVVGELKTPNDRRLVFNLQGKMDRTQFGITAGRPFYGKEADLNIRIIARRQAP
ncbi:MAG: hypothetical protein AcusKO_11910 [Acuticoccus sp.]